MAVDGLITLRSSFGPNETVKKLKAVIEAKGLTIFASVDHAAAAARVDMPLRPTTVVIFGNARNGTPLMQSAQTVGIDLPLKMLVWQDASGATWVSYNDPRWLAKRHELGPENEATLGALAAGINGFAKVATST